MECREETQPAEADSAIRRFTAEISLDQHLQIQVLNLENRQIADEVPLLQTSGNVVNNYTLARAIITLGQRLLMTPGQSLPDDRWEVKAS